MVIQDSDFSGESPWASGVEQEQGSSGNKNSESASTRESRIKQQARQLKLKLPCRALIREQAVKPQPLKKGGGTPRGALGKHLSNCSSAFGFL